jgi:hypothetical protein
VLNMSRQVGAAIGIALLIVLTAGKDPLTGYHHAWILQAAVSALAAVIPLLFGRQAKR